MKTNIKMKCDDNQFRQVMNILKIDYKKQYYYPDVYLIINNDLNVDVGYGGTIYNDSVCEEIDAGLFIRTDGTCEENTFNELFEKVSERVNDFQIGNMIEPLDKYAELENKLKKKNEILKKARIKRKNQREELHKLNLKLNLKLQKCISLEEYTNVITVKNNVIKELENENYLNKGRLHLSSLNNVAQQKEIEKLKAVIEYLESKVK